MHAEDAERRVDNLERVISKVMVLLVGKPIALSF
jgi:hypothetical protein